MRCIVSSSSPSPSSTTATGLPRNGTSVNTSTWRNGRGTSGVWQADVAVPWRVLPAERTTRLRTERRSADGLGQRLAGERDRLGVAGVGDQVDDEAVEAD